MKPLPALPYEVAHWTNAKVDVDYHVEYEGRLYSVPHTLVRRAVEIRATSSTIEVLHDRRRVASHDLTSEDQLALGTGDHLSASHRYDATDNWRGTRRRRNGRVGIAFLRKDDTVWARVTATYESVSGAERRSFGTAEPILVTVIPGEATSTEVTSTEERMTCDSVCRDAGTRCLSATAATSHWVAFEGCPGLGETPSTGASCGTTYSKRSGFSGQVCAFRLHCRCI